MDRAPQQALVLEGARGVAVEERPRGTTARRARRAVAGLRDWRGALLGARWWAARQLAPRRRIRSRGLTFTLQCDNWITHYRCRSYNAKEPETLDWIDQWMRPGDLLFDVGANIGVYAIYAALRHVGSRVIAFEPEYANLHLLRDNIVHNHLQGWVEVYAVGVSNRCGMSRLHIQDLTPGAALHTESAESISVTLANKPVVWQEGISITTLDRFCEETGHIPTAIKIDVDGTELQVLEGAVQTLRQHTLRSVLVELPDDQRPRSGCEALLAAAGLRRSGVDRVRQGPNQLWIRAWGPT